MDQPLGLDARLFWGIILGALILAAILTLFTSRRQPARVDVHVTRGGCCGTALPAVLVVTTVAAFLLR